MRNLWFHVWKWTSWLKVWIISRVVCLWVLIQKIFKIQYYIYLSEVSILWNGNNSHGSGNWNLNSGCQFASFLSFIKSQCSELATLNYFNIEGLHSVWKINDSVFINYVFHRDRNNTEPKWITQIRKNIMAVIYKIILSSTYRFSFMHNNHKR